MGVVGGLRVKGLLGGGKEKGEKKKERGIKMLIIQNKGAY